jgi:hypothetical protein
MRDRGAINSEVLSNFENFKGVNQLAHTVGYVTYQLEKLQALEARKKNFEVSDQIREIVSDLRFANEYLGIQYTPPKDG